MDKILSKEQQKSLHKLENPKRVKVYAKELHKIAAREKGPTSSEPEEI